MFSTRNSALVSHSNGMFTRYSASMYHRKNHTNSDLQNDLIAFLSIVQKFNIDFLPITWQPALGNIGKGGSGTISQSTLITEIPLAFKRFHMDGESDDDFLPLMSEVLILSQPPIQKHLHIVNLEGICWDIKTRTEKAIPVLVFERAAWDLQQFMNVHDGMNMSIDDRLKICADIGSAIMTLHAYDVIHGDIKPQNVLVFKDATRKTIVKVCDFGYSTLAASEGGSVLLPKSRPWNAPEHHFGEFKVSAAKKADVYSFGMLCLWLLFGSVRVAQNGTDSMPEFVSFDASTGPRTWLECLKDEDKLQNLATQLLALTELNTELSIRLKGFFDLTIQSNPEKRTSDLGKLLHLLSNERAELESLTVALEAVPKVSIYTDFRIALNLADFMAVDYRVRTQIKDSLENNYIWNRNQPSATQIAFQLAFCYRIGFGTKSDENQSHTWLAKSAKRSEDLSAEKDAVRPASWKNGRRKIGEFNEILDEFDLIHEYRTRGIKELEKARELYEREASDMAREFGEFHFITLALHSIIGDLLDELREFAASKALRIRVRDHIAPQGIAHPYYLQSMLNVAKSHDMMGELVEQQALQEEVLAHIRNTYGEQSTETASIMSNLAVTLWKRGHWKKAGELEIQGIAIRKRVLGQEHPATLTSIANLALIFWDQGRYEEAEELEVQVMEMFKSILGEEHPDTLNSIANLASTFSKQGRWKEAEKLETQVMEMRKRVLGHEHPDTLISISNLSSTFSQQGRWKEAEEQELQVMETSKRVLGIEHLDTATRMSNVAWAFSKQGRWKEADELEKQVIETRKRVLGEEHPDTLTSMDYLASALSKQGKWKQSDEQGLQVIEIRKRILGQEHPDTLGSMENLALSFMDQGRWNEAEKLELEVVEARKRVLGPKHPHTLASITNLASTFSNQGKWKEAEELEVQMLETSKRVLGKEHPDTLTSMGNLAAIFSEQSRWTEAAELELQVMETSRRVLGQEHPDTLTGISNLASTYSNMEMWKEAEDLGLQVLEIRKRVLGQEHLDTLSSMSNLASIFSDQGRWKEAEELEVQVIESFMNTLGEEHPNTLNSIASLASTFRDQGRMKEAEGLEIQVIETRKKVLGQDHPDTLTSMGNLASIFMEQERWKDAAELETQVLETSKRVYGAEHPDTLTSKDNLASALSKQGRWKEAEELEMQVVDTSKRVLGEDHPDTLTGIANLAATLTKHGRWKEAEELGLQVLEARKRVLGGRHPDTLTSMKNLAVTCSNQRSKAAQEREIEMANKTQMIADEDNPLPAISTTISAALNKESEVPRHLTDDQENGQAKVEIPRSETINVSTEQGKKMGPSPTTRSQTKKNRNVPQNEQGEKRSAFGLAGVVTKRQKRDGNTKNKGKKRA